MQHETNGGLEFQVGRTYRYYPSLRDDTEATVTIASRTEEQVTLTDGRKVKVVMGAAPDGMPSNNGLAEVLRLECDGCFARGGLVSPYNEVAKVMA